jgi:hypothetical protein
MKFLLIFSFIATFSSFAVSLPFDGSGELDRKAAGDGSEVEEKIRLEVKLLSYVKNGLYLDFRDGGSITYDISHVEIVNPLKYKGKTLKVSNPGLTKQSQKWKKKGNSFFISIPKSMIAKRGHISGRLIYIIREN